uniref:Arginine--tRNA ligase n=1 Tax=uncultured Chloroflexota bacterium TaxID=166587 RepID=H5SAL5_9CHLR|nr:arginyl-tRNA synthetase [uncultured Chloroflexota bacterium]
MFEQELKQIEAQIADFFEAQGIKAPDFKWQPVPFRGEWGVGISLFAAAAAEVRQKGWKLPVPQRAQELALALQEHLGQPAGFSRIEALNGYLNLYFSPAEYARRVVDTVLEEGERFGRGAPKGERVMVEYAQPNTHHSFHIGHYRNTILGEVLARLLEFAGFETLRASYPGDIGLGVITVLWIYDKFYRGQEPEGIHERGQWLLKLYVEANALLEPKENETPEERARREAYEAERRELYRRWDAGDPYVRELWLKTRQWSLDELQDILHTLDIHIDVWFFESEVDEPAKQIVQELIERGIAEDERPNGGPVIVHIDEKLGLKKEKYRTVVILRSDGTTLYLTKDLALAKEKFEKYGVDRSIYVVDVRQSLHFQQVFKILELWGFKQAEKCYHLGYGFVSLPQGAMSARRGRVVLFKEVLDEAIARVLTTIEQKNPQMPLELREEVARAVGLGALAYAMLSVDNNKDIVFNMEEALSFEGHTGPYLQNAHVRACSILRKALNVETLRGLDVASLLPPAAFDYPLTSHEVELVDLISRFPAVVQQAAQEYRPLIMANYAWELANAFHSFYHAAPVLQAEEIAVRDARLRLVAATRQVLANALRLLDIQAVEKM